jgi:hypothetical protein
MTNLDDKLRRDICYPAWKIKFAQPVHCRGMRDPISESVQAF